MKILTSYSSFIPPVDFAESVRRLLDSVPQKYLAGLDCIVLRDASSLTRIEKRKSGHIKRKIPCGVYYRATRSTPPRIHLFVDNMARWSNRSLRLPPVREVILGMTLFHELGHHIQERIQPEYKEREAAANAWSGKLLRNFIYRRYWYLLPVLRLLILLRRVAARRG